MKKGVQVAFAIALFILSILASVFNSDVIANIIYAVVIPSFILTIVSFLTEISEKCEDTANNLSEQELSLSNQTNELIEMKKIYCNMKTANPKVVERYKENIEELANSSRELLNTSIANKKVEEFCAKCKKVCNIIIIIGYIILFLSLSLSPYISIWLSAINLNCITLWSLTILFITMEFKTDICKWVYNSLFDLHMNSINKHNEKTNAEDGNT